MKWSVLMMVKKASTNDSRVLTEMAIQMWDKAKSTEKIDGAVATIMALDRAIRCGNDTTESVYDERGILFI